MTWTHATAAAACTLAVLASAPPAAAAPAQPVVSAGELCELVEGVPGTHHPIRSVASLKAAFRRLARADWDPAKNLRAARAFEQALTPLMRRAARAFHPPGFGEEGGEDFDHRPARRFLERHVLGTRAELRIGLDGFEPRPEIASAVVFAACRGKDRDLGVRWAQSVSGPDGVALRAWGALASWDAGEAGRARARQLLQTLTPDGFLAAWVLAEFSEDPAAARRHHAAAVRRQTSPAQQAAVRAQAARHGW